MYRNSILIIALILTMLSTTSVRGNEITGTPDQINCVYNNKESLSFNGLLVPVKVYVQGCVEQFTYSDARDTTHGGVDEPKIEGTAGTPSIENWTVLTLEEIERIPCKLEEWLQNNTTAADIPTITLDLSEECEKQP